MVVQSKAVAIPHNRDPASSDSAPYDVIVTQENTRTKPVQLNMGIVRTVYWTGLAFNNLQILAFNKKFKVI